MSRSLISGTYSWMLVKSSPIAIGMAWARAAVALDRHRLPGNTHTQGFAIIMNTSGRREAE
jgi:hypothetical protein